MWEKFFGYFRSLWKLVETTEASSEVGKRHAHEIEMLTRENIEMRARIAQLERELDLRDRLHEEQIKRALSEVENHLLRFERRLQLPPENRSSD